MKFANVVVVVKAVKFENRLMVEFIVSLCLLCPFIILISAFCKVKIHIMFSSV